MSWICYDAQKAEDDWDQMEFSPGRSEVFIISKKNHQKKDVLDDEKLPTKSCAYKNHWSLCQDSDWKDWLQQGTLGRGNGPTINLVLAERTSELSKLPFTRDCFSEISKSFMVHGSIARIINRNSSCTFSKMPYNWVPGDSLTRSMVYNCRTAQSWDGDMALSVTFFPETLNCNAIWYGCDLTKHDIHGYSLSDSDLITQRLSNFDGGSFHPMLLPTIFADFERERQIGLVRESTTQLIQRIFDLAYGDSSSLENHRTGLEIVPTIEKETETSMLRNIIDKLKGSLANLSSSSRSSKKSSFTSTEDSAATPTPTEATEQEPAIILWVRISYLRNGLENWRAQLCEMIDHVHELDRTRFGIWDEDGSIPSDEDLVALKESGSRIERRLKALVTEYDEFIRECTSIMEGMSLAAQLELNRNNRKMARVNLEIANNTHRDGNLMKSIAFMGMIFLPATFVSTFFSMDFFAWTPEGSSDTVSPYFWVYLATAPALTLITVGIFYALVQGRSCKWRPDLSQIEV